MIKFLRHGTGSAAGAARYVLADTDHLGVLREGVKTLRGNAEMFSAIADSCGFKQRYTSGVIAFAPEDEPSNQELQDVLDSFEELAFAGLEKDDYHLFAVQHDEPDGSKHIHILVPRVHLSTKKSLNIAPPNHSSVFYPWRDFWNETKGWASPKDPARRRRLGKARDGFLLDKQKQKKGLKLEKDEREFIVDSIEQGVKAGEIKNRTDVEGFLRNQFLTEGVGIVSRVVKNSISVRLYQDDDEKKLGKAIRLTGAFFDHDFDADAWLAVQAEKETRGEPSQRPQKPNPDSKLAKELQLRVDEIKMLRAKRQSAYFAYEKAELKDEDNLDLSNLITKGKSDVITDNSAVTRTRALAELEDRVSEQRDRLVDFEKRSESLYAETRELEERVQQQQDSISRARAAVSNQDTQIKSVISRIKNVRERLVIVSDTLAAQQESFRDALLALFTQTLSKSSYSELSAAQADLVPFLHSLVESTNFDLTDKDSSIKLFINTNEQALQDALSVALEQSTTYLLKLFNDGIQPVQGLEPVNFEWVKENLDKTLLEIAKDFNYELDATSAERFAVEHKEVLLALIDQQQDIDRPSY